MHTDLAFPKQLSNAHRKAWEVIVLSDDSEPENIVPSDSKPKTHATKQEPEDPHERPTKRHALNPEIVDIIDSPDNKTKSEFRSVAGAKAVSDGFPKDHEGRYIVTRKAKVDVVESLDEVPHCWPVPEVDTAYVLDFADDARVSGRNVVKKLKGLDTFLKAEVHGHSAVDFTNQQLSIRCRIRIHREGEQMATLLMM
jgi:hypothetical protein